MLNRARYLTCLAVLLGFVATLAGCGPKTIHIDSEPGSPTDYGLLLQRIVVDDKIDVDALLKNRHLLDRYLAFVFQTEPRSTSRQNRNKDSLLAQLINRHNAAVLGSLVALAAGDRMPTNLPWGLDRRFAFLIDGTTRTVADLRREAMTQAGGDWRVRLALYSGRRDGPPLSQRPFLGDLLDAQLDAATRAALKSDQVVRLDFGARKRLLLWRGLFTIRRSLIEDYERRLHTTDATMLNVLLEWSDHFRRETLNSAVGYRVEAMPVDRRINSVQLDKPASATIPGGS